MTKWEKVPLNYTPLGMAGGNYVLATDDFFISYQDFKKGGRAVAFERLNQMMTGDDSEGDETALYDKTTGEWLILWGDHREAYEKAFPDLEKCREVYKKLAPKHACDKWTVKKEDK